MVRLNVIYTRTGDAGETGLGDGSRRPKTDPRVVAMGDVDETNCAIGLARLATRGASDATLASIEATLARIQNDLFDLGADLCIRRARSAGGRNGASSRWLRSRARRSARPRSPM